MMAFLKFRPALALLLALGLACTAHAQTSSMTADEQAVWASVEATWQHFADGDLDAALGYYEHWHRWGIHNSGLWDRADLRDHEERGMQMGRMDDLRLEPVHIQVFGDAAVAHYLAHATFVVNGSGQRFPHSGRWSDFRIREGDRWVIVGGYRDGLCELVGEDEQPSERGNACRERERDVSDGSWTYETLSAAERARYVGKYAETVAPDVEPLDVHVWEEEGILHITALASDLWDEIHLVPMGNHEFVQGRFEDGRLVTVYYPDTRVRFAEEDGRIRAYAFVAGGKVQSEGTRTN